VEKISDRAAQAEEDRTALQQQVQGLEARLAEERDVVHGLRGEVADLQGKLRTCKDVMGYFYMHVPVH
jgi:phage shock protein A